MTPDRLLDHFDRISDAPDAIPRLRRFILDLAARGKLVAQNPNDEPASELLKRIETGKLILVKTGKLKKQENLPPVSEDELAFDVPKGWSATRLAVVAVCLDYMREPINSTEREQRITGKDISQLFPYFGATQQQGWIDDYIFDEELVLLGEDGVPFFDDLRPKAYLISGKSWVNNHAHVFRGILVSNVFLSHALNTFDYSGRVAGATRSKLNQAKALDIPIILPPLAEQNRIVAKVDELMALCDQLEAVQAERENRRDRLAAASLHRLNNGADAESFREHARFHLGHLPRLTTRPEHIQQLRQTILNLAVRGKLVPQDPNDEPASELVKRIQAEIVRLIRESKAIKEAKLPPMTEKEAPFDLPPGWTWARFPELGIFGRGKSKHRPRNDGSLFEGGTHLFVQTGDVARSNGVIKTYTSKYNDIGLAQSAKWQTGTLCITIAANIADSGILSFDACFPDSVVGFIPASVFPSAKYFEYFIRTAKANLLEFAPATAQKNINLGILNAVLIPLPPLTEQHRIVAKVDELMALCDRLEAQLTSTQTESRRLLKAVLEEALSEPMTKTDPALTVGLRELS